MRKLSKTLLSLLLIAAMLASFVVLPAAAEEPAAVQEPAVETQAETTANDSFMKIFHLDCGRKYFTKDWIIALINEISAAGYTHLQLALGNDGMRFLLDDMSLTVNGTTYSSENVAAAIHAGNEKYHDFTVDELTEKEMDAIIAHAKEKNIEILPLINTPGHMDAILDAATSLTYTDCAYNGSSRTIDVTNDTAVAFTQALLQKYVTYFAGKGCKYFNIGADEYANDKYTGGSMGFGNLQLSGKYGYFIKYVNELATMVKSADMKPVAFNDGIEFYGVTSANVGSTLYKFDKDIIVSYWSAGWSGYEPQSAANLVSNGFKVINTTGDFYYVLGKGDNFDAGYSYASNWSNTRVCGMSLNAESVVGATFCVWCDYPGAETEQEIAQKIRLPLRAMAQRMKGESVVLDENELVSGGFKADGTINAATVSDEATGVSVMASGLTGITVAAVDKGTELDGKKVVGAWNIELTTENGSYTDSATVSIPVGEEWLSYKLTGGVLESDGTTVTSDPNSKVENGVLTFTAKHFSTVVVLAEEKQKEITVTVGRTEPITVDGEVSSAYTDEFVTVKTETKDKDQTYIPAELAIDTLYVSTKKNDTAPTLLLTFEDAGNGQYYIKNGNDQYISPLASYGIGWKYSVSTGNKAAVNITTHTDGSVVISRSFKHSGYFGTYETTAYLTISGSSFAAKSTATNLYLYRVEPVKQTTISFTGKKAGTTRVKIGDVLYIITVSPENLDNVSPLKIEYWITNSRLTGTTSSKNELSIAATLAGVASAEGVEIASLVDAEGTKDKRSQEYWQSKILDVQKSNDSTSGTELQTTKQGDDETLNGTAFTKVRYWNGKWQVFTNAWVDVDRTQVTVTYTGDSGSVTYNGDRNQLVAYYMEVVNINNENGESELHVNAADWGTKGDGTGDWGYTPESSRCSVSIQLVYEDGSVNPTDTTAANLKSKTIVYGYWNGGRGLGTMVFTGQQGYEIYKVTAETGTMTSTPGSGNTVTVTRFTWAKNEETVWEGDQTKSVSIGNPARKPSYEAPYDNLAWNTDDYNKNNAILIRVYVKAEIKEDSLKVHYIDEKSGKQFYEYGIPVKTGTYFHSGFAMDPNQENALINNSVENYNGVVQTVTAELKDMPQIKATYRYSNYTLQKVERQADGKEVFLYYTFNNFHTFVVDFGIPLLITPENIGVNVPEGEGYWTEATCSGATYGETSIVLGRGLTYTATKPMQGVETLQVTLAIGSGEDEKTTHTIYLVPATTVYYEQNVATYSDGWNSLGTIAADKYQETQKGRIKGYNFGYDLYYEQNQLGANGSVMYTTTPGASAQLTFKGTGMELYLRTQNANDTSELTETDATNHSYMLVQVYAGDTADANNLKRMSFVDVNNLFVAHGSDKYGYNTPCWTVDGMAYDTYTVVVRYVKGTTYGLAIDGFRVTNTLNPSDATTNGFYADVGEANMQTAEIRNMVLAQANVNNAIFGMSAPMYQVGVKEVLDAVFDDKDVISGATIIDSNGTVNTNVTVDENLVNIGPKNEIYLNQGEAVVMQLTGSYDSVQVGMRSLTGDAVTYKINTEEKTMNSTVDMYYKVTPAAGKLVIQNVSGGILALTRLKVTSATAATTNDPGVVPQTTPEAIRYAMALMRGIDVPQFTDVAEDAWYHDYVYDLVYRGVVNGMTATTYEPEGKLTRAQFVKLLACSLADAETLKTYEGKHPFKDSEGHWAEAYIAWAKDKGIVEGVSATEFDPEAPITREQMATIFGRYALKQGIELPKDAAPAESFPDADKISEYAREFVELMRIAGILNGYEDGTFRPQGNATRAEAAKLFSLFLSITDKLAK
ncbi:S-layer homology domain-containing protein [Faecousia sp.]|uniref:S-layer homology domain-containing protein n=1 Tax=Faecousia sp. TaxID=2952921 RepID=UPI003A9110E7